MFIEDVKSECIRILFSILKCCSIKDISSEWRNATVMKFLGLFTVGYMLVSGVNITKFEPNLQVFLINDVSLCYYYFSNIYHLPYNLRGKVFDKFLNGNDIVRILTIITIIVYKSISLTTGKCQLLRIKPAISLEISDLRSR